MVPKTPPPSGSALIEPKPNLNMSQTVTSAVRHLVLVGACYMDTILTVPFFPEEDSKLRATGLQVRRGGNCPNTLEVLQQLGSSPLGPDVTSDPTVRPVPYLVSSLPAREALATKKILASFGGGSVDGKGSVSHHSPISPPAINFDHCLYRDGHQEPASSYIIRNAATQSRTIVNYNDLAEMTTDEFIKIANAFAEKPDASGEQSWWHFEVSEFCGWPNRSSQDNSVIASCLCILIIMFIGGDLTKAINDKGRIPTTTLQCIRYLRQVLPRCRISVEVEKPNREGLDRLASEADVVFYSRTWAEYRGYAGPEACLRGQAVSPGPSLMLCTWGEHGASGLFRSGDGEWEYMQYRAKPSEGGISVVDTIGAGDTFIAGMLFGLVCHAHGWSQHERLAFATELATKKVQIDGFVGLVG